jgi:hypothetical protein
MTLHRSHWQINDAVCTLLDLAEESRDNKKQTVVFTHVMSLIASCHNALFCALGALYHADGK